MKTPSIIARLDHGETARMENDMAKVAKILGETGLKREGVRKRLQTDLWDVYQRKSMACPYEIQRAQLWCQECLPLAFKNGDHQYFVTLGRPQDRLPVGSLKKYDPIKLNRQLGRGIAKLRAQRVKHLKVFAVLEVQLVKPLDGPPYWEPHLHLIVSGATAEQIKEAFQVRKLAATNCRKRPVHVRAITDLDGVISYCLKFHPKVQVQYQTEAGLRWRENRMPSEYLPEWYRFMSRHSPGEMLKFVGINGHELMQPLACELCLDLSQIRHGRP